MAEAWTAKVEVAAALAQRLIAAQFPELAPVQVELLGAGWDNTAYRVNHTLVFRFPRRPIAVPLLETERRLLPLLTPRLPLPIPVPTFAGQPGAGYPWPFQGYALLPGRTACAADLSEADRHAAAAPLGRFLAALHAVPAALAQEHGAGLDTLGRLAVAQQVPRLEPLLEQLIARRLVEDPSAVRALLHAAPLDVVPRRDTLVHGDLYIRQLLVDADNRLAGVIDWGDLHLGDPGVDLAAAHMILPPSAHAAFRQAYGPIAECTWRLARFRALWHTAHTLRYAAETHDAALLREEQRALGYLAASAGCTG